MRFPTFGLRTQPRVPVAALCNTIVDERDQMALVVDLSEKGLRLERPLRGSGHSRVVQLEFEVPEIDEIVWARGEVCFDQLRAVPPSQAARVAVRATGVRIVAAATRHLRLIRDYVQLVNERHVERLRELQQA